MAVPLITPALATGEVSPSLFGRIDLDRERIACGTCRNGYVNYRGGVSSRGGTKFVNFSRQTGRQFPPRLVPFQFSIDQGLALEFGHQYMRIVDDGAMVTEEAVAIGGATQASPTVLTFGTDGADTATPINTTVTFSYAPGDLITLAGGTYLTPAVLEVDASSLVSILVNNHGTGYTVADTVTLGLGTFSAAAIVTVATVVSVSATGYFTFAANPADGDTITLNGTVWTFKTLATPGAAETTIQDTLAATMVQLSIDLNASADVQVVKCTYTYTTTRLLISFDTPGAGGNAFTLAASVATRSAATLTGGTATGLGTVTVTTPGVYTALPANGNMTQTASSGGGTAATFQTAVFGVQSASIDNPGAYTSVPVNPVLPASTTGIGVGVQFTMTWAAIPPFANGDWVAISGVLGMTELNGNTYELNGVTATTAQLLDVYGNAVDSSAYVAYTGGGIVQRIYTVDTPYDEEDLPYLKFTQSADEMSLCCVNQATGVEYAPQTLTRFGATDWRFSDVVAVSTVDPPATVTAAASGPGATFYSYVVTAVSPIDGTESVASSPANVTGVSISTELGQINLSWTAVEGVSQYNIYKAQPSYGSNVPAGALYGYAGSAYGNQWIDSNIIPDYSLVPPQHRDPFARGQIAAVNVVTGGSGYTSAPTLTITTSTGAGADGEAVIVNGALVAIIVTDAGHDYADSDTLQITGGGGVGATATLVIGPETGTYPSVPGYFQQRRVYANTLNAPDTYFMSQPGAFDNFDARIPPITTDALSGSPWAVQVDGIQFIPQISSGLLVMTGAGAWILVGAGSFATNAEPIAPGNQQANPQPFTGCSPILPPVKINFDIIYVTSKGSFYYDLPYQGIALSEALDLTEYSTHLFVGHTAREHAWCEQPFKTLWSVRDDGIMLSLTFLKAQQVVGWARHDTEGYYRSVCSVTEPPVDALYMVVQRFPNGNDAYMIERADNRIWAGIEDAWCVDSGLATSQETPSATLMSDSAYGVGTLTGATITDGGSGWSDDTVAVVVDDNGYGPGTGAVVDLTIVAGVITNVAFAPGGADYINPQLSITDPTNGGSGYDIRIILDTTANFTASAAVFEPGDISRVLRMGGGIADITQFFDTQNVAAVLRQPITTLRPNSGLDGSTQDVLPAIAGDWTISTPITTVRGMAHLAGAVVTGLADGKVVTPRQVSSTGDVVLDEPATAIVLGLGFGVQVQSTYADGGSPTIQGQRKKIAAVSALLEASRDVMIGACQPDGSTFNPPQIAPQWTDMVGLPNLEPAAYNSDVEPLYTGYTRTQTLSGFQKPGQVALEQNLPVPLNLLAFVSEVDRGDVPETGKGEK